MITSKTKQGAPVSTNILAAYFLSQNGVCGRPLSVEVDGIHFNGWFDDRQEPEADSAY